MSKLRSTAGQSVKILHNKRKTWYPIDGLWECQEENLTNVIEVLQAVPDKYHNVLSGMPGKSH